MFSNANSYSHTVTLHFLHQHKSWYKRIFLTDSGWATHRQMPPPALLLLADKSLRTFKFSDANKTVFVIPFAFKLHILSFRIIAFGGLCRMHDRHGRYVDWLCAKVVRVFKGKIRKRRNSLLVNMFMPISLTSCCCKLMEHIIQKSVITYLENNKHLYAIMRGFSKMINSCTITWSYTWLRGCH